jgi:hypothetical protein
MNSGDPFRILNFERTPLIVGFPLTFHAVTPLVLPLMGESAKFQNAERAVLCKQVGPRSCGTIPRVYHPLALFGFPATARCRIGGLVSRSCCRSDLLLLRVRRLKKRMNYYDRSVKKAIMVAQRLDSARPLCSDDEEEGDYYRSMEHSEPIAQVAV